MTDRRYARRVAERRDRWAVERFLHDVVRWYEEGYDRMTPEERAEQRLLFVLFLQNRDPLESAADAVAALPTYLAARKAEVNAD
jgi:predicted hydrolase (HD superfamily)